MNYQPTKNTLGNWAYIAIAKSYKKILNHESQVLKDENPKQLDRITEGILGLDTAISSFAPALNLPISASEKNLGKIVKVLDKLGDINMIQDIINTQDRPDLIKIERKNLKALLKSLKKQRKSAFKEVKSTLRSRKYVKLKTELEAWLECPNYNKISLVKIQRILPDLLLSQASKFLSHPGWLVGVQIKIGDIVFEEFNPNKLSSNKIKLLLDLGKCAKKTYYHMELFNSFYGNLYDDYLQKITKIKKVLEDIRDLELSIQFLAALSNNEPKVYMPCVVENIEKNRLIKFQEWQDLQKYFLHHRRQQEFRAILQYPI